MDLQRMARHLLLPDWTVRRAFSSAMLDRIEAAIRESEKFHNGELRFAAEAGLDLVPLLRGLTPRQRAVDVFSQLRVWDTVHNSGVLIYVQLVDRHIEIVADRGINARVQQSEWDAICRRMELAFRAGEFEAGVMEGIREITALLARYFPPGDLNPDELPDRPVVL
jgi:uncharacterized membrane protein